ncbi:MAG TPA: hypothetical protein VK698_00425 [Kofleriaceae bacterium]|nr:hypothetical protein [Kofleriaceae bacterium]
MVIRASHALLAAGAIAVGVLAWLLTRGPALGPEKQIAALIDDAVEDAEDGDVGDLMDAVSAAYQGEGGDRAGLRSYLTGLVLGGGIDVKVLSQQVAVAGDSATADLEVVVVRGGLRGAAEGDVGARTVHVELAREDGDWKVTRGQVD